MTTDCLNPLHDHTTPVDREGNTLPAPVPMRCVDCDAPAHYDMGTESYEHDDPTAPECFLVPFRMDGATPCTII